MRNSKEIRPSTVLTTRDKQPMVMEDLGAYKHFLDIAAEASAIEGIRQGLEDLTQGRTRPAIDVFDELRGEYGIPR